MTWDPWTFAEDLEVRIFRRELPHPIRGMYACPKGYRAHIIVDSRLDEVEARCVLAEELGHHVRRLHRYPVVAMSQWNEMFHEHVENHAMEWATERMLPAEAFLDACARLDSAEEIAREFQVTVEFVQFRAARLQGGKATA